MAGQVHHVAHLIRGGPVGFRFEIHPRLQEAGRESEQPEDSDWTIGLNVMVHGGPTSYSVGTR